MLTVIKYFDKDTIKNILTVLSVKPEKVVYLYDKELKNMNFFLGIEKCVQGHISQIIVERYPIDSNSIEGVYEKTAQIIEENGRCMIDLTGGSELMMIGGYKAGKEAGAEMVYTDILKGEIVNVENGEIVRKAATLSLSDFVDARGACFIGNSHREPKEERYDHYLRMGYFLFDNLKNWKKTCSFLQTAMANSPPEHLECKSRLELIQREGRRFSPDKAILYAFQKNGFIKELKFTGETVRFFFASAEAKSYMINFGVWLELFVYIHARRLGVFDDVKLGAMIDWNAYDGITVAGNEIDVIISDHSLPVFISCKLRDADTAAINELVIARKRLGGWFSKGILVAFGNDRVNKTGVYKRAQELGVEILDKRDILSRDFGERLLRAVRGHDLVGNKWKTI